MNFSKHKQSQNFKSKHTSKIIENGEMTIENDPDKDNNKCTFHRNVLYIAEMNGFWSIFFTDAKSWGAVSRRSDRIFEHGLF